MGFRVQGVGLRIWVLGFQSLRYRTGVLGFRA